MWIFLNNAYLSIVKHKTLPNSLLVRARHAGDIEAVFPNASVQITPRADYLFRAAVSKLDASVVLNRAIMGIDYDNFKASIVDADYHDACMNVWVCMNAYQREGTYQRDRKYHAKKKKKK